MNSYSQQPGRTDATIACVIAILLIVAGIFLGLCVGFATNTPDQASLSQAELSLSLQAVEDAKTESRSPKWHGVRDKFLAEHPACEVCGCKHDLNVHHIVPFHVDRAKELDPSNLITLGEKCPGGNHHLLFGHLGNWKSWNVNVRKDAAEWRKKIENRP